MGDKRTKNSHYYWFVHKNMTWWHCIKCPCEWSGLKCYTHSECKKYTENQLFIEIMINKRTLLNPPVGN